MASLTRRRVLIVLTLLAALLAIGVVVGRGYAISRAEAELAQRGCTADALTWAGPKLRASRIRCPGVEIGSASMQPWPLSITLRAAEVDLEAWLPSQSRGAGDSEQRARDLSRTAGLLATAQVQGLTLRMGEEVLIRDLKGGLDPIDLHAPDFRLIQREEILELSHRRELDGETLRGLFEIELSWDLQADAIEGRLRGSGIIIQHPLLADRPLPGLALDASFEGSTGQMVAPWLEGDLGFGGPRATWRASLDDEGLPVLELELPDSPADEVLAPLAPLAPEIDRATIRGALGLSVHWEPARSLSITPRIAELWVDGAVEPGLGLDWGAFTYMVRDEEGERVPRRSGEGTPGWTPLEAISPDFVHAVLAAEDSAYFRHEGYHLPAIQAAIDADIEAGEVVRGGSTLTQQLAKNLFLDGEQTLARKLRELLLAVELDRSLGKDRCLELYLNIVEYGPGLYGVGAASERFFMKRPERLALHEAVFLAALLPSPRSAYERWYLGNRPNRARMTAILDNMVDGEWIGPRHAAQAKRARLSLVPPPR